MPNNLVRKVPALLFFVGAMLATSLPAYAQLDLTGLWAPPRPYTEDEPERGPGPALVEFLGLPINDYARQWGLAFRPSRLSLPEHQCQVHVVEYIHRGPLAMRIWEERDPVTHQLIAIHRSHRHLRTASHHLDGRPSAPFSERPTHVDGLFDRSVGREHADRRYNSCEAGLGAAGENIPASDEVTVIEHYVRREDMLTHISVTDDPVYLEEPLVKSEEFVLNPDPNNFNPFWPCEYVEEGEHTRGEVPSYFPGENPWMAEYAATHDLPQEATLGGAATIYPEYRSRLKMLPKAVFHPQP